MMFPILAKIEFQVLAILASTVAMEQTFSKRGNILDPRRSRLTPDSLEAQACIDDWSKAEERIQDQLIQSSSFGEFLNDASATATFDYNDSS